MAVGMKQGFEQIAIRPDEGIVELCQPIIGGDRAVVRFVEHGRFSSPAVFAAFP
jgi:hypothetical protein